MSVILTIADPNDASLEASAWKHEGGQTNSNLDFESDARRGEGAIVEGGNAPESGQRLKVGGQKWNNGDQTNRYEAFLMFKPERGFAVPADRGLQEIVSAALRVSRKSLAYNASMGDLDSLAFWKRDWNEPLSGSAWMDLMAISGSGTSSNFQPEGELSAWAMDRTAGVLYEAGGEAFLNHLRTAMASGTQMGLALVTWTSTQVYPNDAMLVVNITSANDVLTAPKYHPTLNIRSQRKHALNSVGGASIQMTDGTAVFLRYDDVTKKYNLYYQKVNQSTPTLIDYLRGKVGAVDNSAGAAQYFGYEAGFQAYGLTRDAANNLYVTGPRGNPQTGTYGQKVGNICSYTYQGNYAWTRITQGTFGSNTASDTDTHRGFINNTVPVWLPGGLTPSGRIVALHSRRDGQWGRYQTGVHCHSAGWTLAESGAAQNAKIGYLETTLVSQYWRPQNSSGSNLDAFRDGDTVRIATALAPVSSDDAERSAAATCSIAQNNTVSVPTLVSSSISTQTPHDPDGKVRALWMGDSSAYWAIARSGHIQVLRKSDGGTHRQIDLPSSGVAGFPSRAVLQSSQAWDVVWDSNDPDWIWTYFRDANNPRLLGKVRWNYVTGTLDSAFQLTPDPLGESGAEIVAIRVPRQQVDARCVLVDVAMQTGAGAPAALITLRDTSMNKAPRKPVLDAIASFNATASKVVEWLFGDSTTSDFATFQDVEIRNVATGSNAHTASRAAVTPGSTAGKYRYTIPAATLSNDTAYQIRIRSYDSVDFPSEWSEWVQFSTTTTGGTVEITDPPADNLPLNRSAVDVTWVYSNTNPAIVQTGYRVRVYNNQTGASISDSGTVVSTATTHSVTGLISDIEYRIEVSVRDSNTQFSGAGARLVTPDFNNPSVPEIVALTLPGRIEIRVTNPPPTGENPVTTSNQIARKPTGSLDEEYAVIGECPPNGVYQDWTVASGVSYTYKARGSSE